MITRNFDRLDDLKDKLSKAGVEVQMTKDSIKLIPTLKFDLAKLEHILWKYFAIILDDEI